MPSEPGRDPRATSGRLRGLGVIGIGIGIALPFVLMAALLVVTESQVTAGAVASAPPGGPGQSAPYAQTFAMTILDQGQTVTLWVQDLDTEPYYRQSVEVDGTVVSEQLYRFDERTLYSAELDAAGVLTWSRVPDVEPASLGLSSLTTGPAAWAAQFGTGEQQIPMAQGTLLVTIHGVGPGSVSAADFAPPETVIDETPTEPGTN